MSFDGYWQYLCKNGHYSEIDCYEFEQEPELNNKNYLCPICGSKYVWCNLVDITNGSFEEIEGSYQRIDGYVKLKLKNSTKCDKGGSTLEKTYEIPIKE